MYEAYVENTVSEVPGAGSAPVASVENTAAPEIDYSTQLMEIRETLTAMQTHGERPLLTTPFEEYTVSEGLILLLLVFLVLRALIKIVKAGFSWLLW